MTRPPHAVGRHLAVGALVVASVLGAACGGDPASVTSAAGTAPSEAPGTTVRSTTTTTTTTTTATSTTPVEPPIGTTTAASVVAVTTTMAPLPTTPLPVTAPATDDEGGGVLHQPSPPPEVPDPPAAPIEPPPAQRVVDAIPGVAQAQQVVVVEGAGWSSTGATLTAYERQAGTLQAVLGPVPAFVGARGFSLSRHEGDLTSPAGTFGIGFAFGSQPDPGTALGYRPIEPGDCWSSAPGPTYNRWVHDPAAPCGPDDEDLVDLGRSAYRYAALVDFNYAEQVPGIGSAIFLHVSTGGTTAGCVAIPEAELVALLTWLRPGAVIAMGPSELLFPR